MAYDTKNHRVWIAGWRIHHGFVGSLLAAIGAVLMGHDWKDRKRWFKGV